MTAILTNGVLKIRTAPIFQPLLSPARYKGSGSTKARDVPPPMPRIVRPGGRQHRLELAPQRQTAKLTLSHTEIDRCRKIIPPVCANVNTARYVFR